MSFCATGIGGELMRPSLSTRSWLERDLHLGDLRTLSEIAYGLTARPGGHGPVDRLCKRGFLMKTDRAPYFSRVTLKGWTAVLLRQTIARKGRTETLDALKSKQGGRAPASLFGPSSR